MAPSALVGEIGRYAADEALRAGSELVQPDHFFLAILKLALRSLAAPNGETNSTCAGGAESFSELRTLCACLSTANCDANSVRMELRRRVAHVGLASTGPDRVLHRSGASLRLFRRASGVAGRAGASTVNAVHLLLALLEKPEADQARIEVLHQFGIDLNRLRAEVRTTFAAASGSPAGRRVAAPALSAAGGEPAQVDARVGAGLSVLGELTARLASETHLSQLLSAIVVTVVDAIPSANRGALLLGSELRKAAEHPPGSGASTTLARRTLEAVQPVIWSGEQLWQGDIPWSVSEFGIGAAMYVPIVREATPVGVLCVDASASRADFGPADMSLLQAVAQLVATALAYHELRKRNTRNEEILAIYAKLVPLPAAEHLRIQAGATHLGGSFRDVTLLFSDIRGFTGISAAMRPHQVEEMIADYLGHLVPEVYCRAGTIDKYVGDGILAVFDQPEDPLERNRRAIEAALAMQKQMLTVNKRRDAHGKRTGELGIGIHCGEVLQGFIGAEQRMEYTVIGDAVNRASRYCDGARGGEVLVSPDVYQWVWREYAAEPSEIPTKHEGNLRAYAVGHLHTKAGRSSA